MTITDAQHYVQDAETIDPYWDFYVALEAVLLSFNS